MGVTVISACYGDYDEPAAVVEQDVPCDFLLVADRMYEQSPWDAIVERRPLPPRLSAKFPKCRPDLYTAADVTIWVDASFEIHSPQFVKWCLQGLGDGVIAMIEHPERSSLTAEAEASADMPKYADQDMRAQVEHYLGLGIPDECGLWATGLIVKRQSNAMLGTMWLNEQLRWTFQDQLSLPVVLRRCGFHPRSMGRQLWDNEHFTIRSHNAYAPTP